MKDIKEKMEKKKNPLEAFQTQYDPKLPVNLKRTVCGIASLYTGLKYLNRVDGDFSEFVRNYISSSSYNIPVYYIQEKIGNEAIDIPIQYFPTESPNDLNSARNLVTALSGINEKPITRKYDPTAKPQRGFSLANGFDHRGISNFFEKQELGNLKAEVIEKDKLPNTLEQDSFILASVDHKGLGYPAHLRLPNPSISTHIICIMDMAKIGDTDVALFSDPAYLDPRDAVQIRTVDSLNQILNGHYTKVSTQVDNL